MTILKRMMLLAVLAICIMVSMGAKPASAANSHLYVYGLGTETGAIRNITIYDNTTSQYEGHEYSLAWGGPWGAPSAIRAEIDGLTPGHYYTITVFPTDFDDSYAQSVAGYMGSDGFKWTNITFDLP